MGIVSFVGRVLFVSVFLLSAYQEFSEFGTDGGPAAKALKTKFNVFVKNISTHIGVTVPHVELKHVIAATIALKGLGGLLFILSSTFGAYLLLLNLALVTPIVYDFYNYDMEKNRVCPALCEIHSGPGPLWCSSLLPWHEEHHPEEAGQEEGSQGEDKLRPFLDSRGRSSLAVSGYELF